MQGKVSTSPQIAHIRNCCFCLCFRGLEFVVIKREMFPLEKTVLVALSWDCPHGAPHALEVHAVKEIHYCAQHDSGFRWVWVNWHLPMVMFSWWDVRSVFFQLGNFWLIQTQKHLCVDKMKLGNYAGLIAFALLHHSLHPPATRMCCCVEHFHRHPWLLASGWVCRLCGERIWSFPWSPIHWALLAATFYEVAFS